MIVIGSMIVALSSVLLSLFYSWLYSSFHKKGLPPFSNMSILEMLRSAYNGTILADFFNASRHIGPIYCVTSPNNLFFPSVICGDIELLKIVLLGDDAKKYPAMDKSPTYKRFNFMSLGIPSVFTKKTENEGWHWARKGVAPSFSNTNLYQTIPVLNNVLNRLIELMRKMSEEGKEFDIVSLTIHFTIDFLTLSMFDECFNTLADFEKPFDEATSSDGKKFLNAMTAISKEFLRVSTDPIRKFRFWDTRIRQAKAAQMFQLQFTSSLLERYRVNHSAEYIEKDQSIMGHLHRSPYPSDLDRCADMVNFLMAGHETTGCGLSWTILEVARHPYVLAKIRRELEAVNPDRNVPFDSSHLSKLDYLFNVIREALRLWPPAAVASSRFIDRDIHYKDYVIPKGAFFQVNALIAMRTGISEPDEFIPERWGDTAVDSASAVDYSDDQSMARDIQAERSKTDRERLLAQFIPFSLGKRNCVGQNMAMLEMKLVLATLFRLFEFRLAPSCTAQAQTESDARCSILSQQCDHGLLLRPRNAILTAHESSSSSSSL